MSERRTRVVGITTADEAILVAEPAPQAAEAQGALEDLRSAGETLAKLGAALGLSAERLAQAESLDRLEADTTLGLDALGRLSEDAVTGWLNALAPDLRLDLRLTALDADGEQESITLQSAAGCGEQLQALRTMAEQVADQDNDVAIEVRLSVGKTRVRAAADALLEARDGAEPGTLAPSTSAVYYCSAALTRLMRIAAAPDWERLGLTRPDARTLVVLCDASGYLAGPALELVGARSPDVPRWLPVSRSAWRRLAERASEQRELRDEETSWPSAPALLTPEHLLVLSRAQGLEAVGAALGHMRAELAAACLASVVQEGASGELVLRFAGPRPCVCRLPAAPKRSSSAKELTGELARLAAWAYQHGSPDKLAIARECLARELPPGGELALADVERAAAGALEAAKANFVLYLRHNSAAYFEHRQRALDAVGTYAGTLRKAVSDLTGEVVDAVYRTAGLLVGVVIAGLIQPALSLDVQRLAALLVAAYVLFILIFPLRARWQRYELDAADLDATLGAMSELSGSERTRLHGRADAANQLFKRYFRFSRAIYAALALVAALYFILLLTPLAPHIALPHTTPTPSTTAR